MRLRIKTKDSFGEDYDTIFSAIKEKNNLGVKYTYNDNLGTVRVFVLKDKIQIIRNGEIKSTKLLKENQNTTFVYKASYMSRTFEIFTKSLKIDEKKIFADYSILEGNEVVNNINLEINEL